jgi:hypothetical protein
MSASVASESDRFDTGSTCRDSCGSRTRRPHMLSADTLHALLRVTHIAGGLLAFVVAPLALFAVKGSRKHIVSGRCFALGMGTAATAGIAVTPADNAGLLLLGFLLLYFTGTGYLAPRIGRGSRTSYRWDRLLTAMGLLASLGLTVDGLRQATLTAPVTADALFGGLGAWVAVHHARWRGPADPSRWRVEHFSALLAAYSVAWVFVLAQFARSLPQSVHVVVPILALASIVCVQQRLDAMALAGAISSPNTRGRGPQS